MNSPTVGMTFRQRAVQRTVGATAAGEFFICVGPSRWFPPWLEIVAGCILALQIIGLIVWRIRLAPHLTTNTRDPATQPNDQPGLDLVNEVWNQKVTGRKK